MAIRYVPRVVNSHSTPVVRIGYPKQTITVLPTQGFNQRCCLGIKERVIVTTHR